MSDDVSDLLAGDFGVWTIATNLVEPIFEGGRLRAGIHLLGSNRVTFGAGAPTPLLGGKPSPIYDFCHG